MPELYRFEPEQDCAGMRLDQYLSEHFPDKTRSSIQKLISKGMVKEEKGTVFGKGYRLKGNEVILFSVPEPEPLELKPEAIPLDVVYEDNDLLVVNKPKGMVVHPAAGNWEHTLVNALLFHCQGSLSGINGVIRPGIVHRIDKDTSGLLMVAKNDQAHLGLAEQIKCHSFTRIYETMVYGRVKEKTGTVNQPIGRSEKDRKKMCVTQKNSKPAVTHYEVVGEYEQFTHLRLRLETGRTHQIRVHMAYLGHPVAGDPLYGPKKCISSLQGQCLHAKYIGFIHPITGNFLEFETPLPDYFQKFLHSLEHTKL